MPIGSDQSGIVVFAHTYFKLVFIFSSSFAMDLNYMCTRTHVSNVPNDFVFASVVQIHIHKITRLQQQSLSGNCQMRYSISQVQHVPDGTLKMGKVEICATHSHSAEKKSTELIYTLHLSIMYT